MLVSRRTNFVVHANHIHWLLTPYGRDADIFKGTGLKFKGTCLNKITTQEFPGISYEVGLIG